MAGFIILEDGREWSGANWSFRAVIEAIVEVLKGSEQSIELAMWLEQLVETGVYLVELREVAPQFRVMFHAALPVAYRKQQEAGGSKWHQPEFFQPWLMRFKTLLELAESVERGETPETFDPDELGPFEPTSRRSGPGW